MAAAAEARAQLDWLIGMNHSRAATLHHHATCSVGRVQTPTLAMIVRRQREIDGFIKTYFYEVHAEMQGATGEFLARALNAEGKPQFDERPIADAIQQACPPATPARVTAVEVKPRRTPPPQLHNLGELQKEANRRFGLTADRTLAAAQTLYEAKAITYPRSSSRHLPEDMVAGLGAVLRALRMAPEREPFRAAALARVKAGPRLSKRFVDDAKLSDHHAIIPTAKGLGGLSGDEAKVYAMLAERFLVIWLPDKETEETRIDLLVGAGAGAHPFRARGSRLVAPGWTALTAGGEATGAATGEDAEDRQALPRVTVGESLRVLDSELVTKERKPPVPYTDATLLTAMETAGRAIDDEALREAMRGRGLGTEATRAAILQRLLDLSYVVREGKSITPTGKGAALIAGLEAAVPHLASPELTGDMEAKLALVEAGALAAGSLLQEAVAMLRLDIPAVFRAPPMAASAPAPGTPALKAAKGEIVCPKCKAGLVTRRADAAFYGCSRFREGCDFTVQAVVAKKPLTAVQVGALCSPARRYRTAVLKGLTSKTGRKFNALLWLNAANGWRAEFEFER